MLATPRTALPRLPAGALLSAHSAQPLRQHGLVWPRRSGNRAAVVTAAMSGGGTTDPAPPSTAEAGEPDGLLPEEDFVVPGTPNDSLTSNTALGRAVGSACEELESLAALEAEAASAAAELLLKLGYRVSKVADAPPEEGGGDGGAA